MLDLLEFICERFSPLDNACVQVSCPNHSSHSVLYLAFVLLQHVEAVFGSAEQKVEKILVPHLVDPLLTALTSRVMRQVLTEEDAITLDNVTGFYCNSADHAEDIYALFQRCRRVNYPNYCRFIILDEIGAKGWTALANAALLHPGFTFFSASRQVKLIS